MPLKLAIDTVTLYLNAGRQKEYYSYLVDLKPRRVIFNPGTENFELISILEKEGIITEIACTLVLLVYRKLLNCNLMLAEYDYHCPHCNQLLNADNTVIFKIEKSTGEKGFIELNPKVGEYSYKM